MTSDRPRSLPLRVAIGDGEALDSWLLRLALRNQTPAQWLLPVLGLGGLLRPWNNHALVGGLPPHVLRRIEIQAGLAPRALDAAVLDPYSPLGLASTLGSRFCPDCLREPDFQWPIRWQLPYTFACLRHDCLLAGYCPACQHPPQSRWSARTGLVDASWCTIRPRSNAEVCGADLRDHQPHRLTADDARLATQQWINTRLDAMDNEAVDELRDLDALALWFRRRLHPPALASFGEATVAAAAEYQRLRRSNTQRRRRAAETIVVAAVATQAVQLLTSPTNESLFACFRPLTCSPEQAVSDRPLVVSHKSLTTITSAMRARLLAASDPHLAPSDRLRYRTATRTPRLTDSASATVAGDRARHLPEYLWQEWIIRLRPASGSFTDTIAADIPAVLLIPGNPIPNLIATSELTKWRSNTTRTLGLLAEQGPDAIAALCALADYLDNHGSPIDYRRRRATFTDVPMDRHEWEELCYRVDAHPGKTTRHLNARRYVFGLLTGANLSNKRHRLAFPRSTDKQGYIGVFQRTISTPLRDALHEYAQAILDAAGISEPLTWSPPGDCVAGFTLPGRDPDDIDLNAVRQLVNTEQLPITIAADRLGVTADHIRYALQRLHQPSKINGRNTPPASRRLHERAAILLTEEFFQREYIQAGKDLRTIETETGIHRKLLADHARAVGVPLADVRTMNTPIPIDADWLREQSEVLQRSATDIAAELGLTPETVRRNLIRFGIARRPQGIAGLPSHVNVYPELPDEIRRAVEGPHHGWLRLRRFQQVITYPSLNTAAKGLGAHLATLLNQVQRLEADIGEPLLHRGRPYRPMSPTEHGQHLLELLQQPQVARLVDRYAKPLPGWRQDDPRRDRGRVPPTGGVRHPPGEGDQSTFRLSPSE